jgi:hypothetical protein
MVVEGETADIALFVLFGFFEALLKLPFLLEAVLLGHLSFLFLRLHDTTLMTEILQLTVKHLVSAELTFQRTIIKRYLDARLQTNLLETFLTVRENPGIVTLELMLQPFTDHPVSAQKVGC